MLRTFLLLIVLGASGSSLAWAQVLVQRACPGAEISVDGGITWNALTPGTVINASDRVRAPASCTLRLRRTVGCKNRYTVHWNQANAVAHYRGQLFSSPAPIPSAVSSEPILFPADYWDMTEQDFTTTEGPGCGPIDHTDHCGTISPFAVAVPTETVEEDETSYTVTHDSERGRTLIFNHPESVSSLDTWAIVGPEPGERINVLSPGEAGVYRADGSFERVDIFRVVSDDGVQKAKR